MLLGSSELGRELTISLKRLGCKVVACDKYENAPAMQLADEALIFDMLEKEGATVLPGTQPPTQNERIIQAILDLIPELER